MTEDFSGAYWDDHYRRHHAGHEAGSHARPNAGPHAGPRRPNPQLVAEATALPPGTALDAGCGEGADATWLAERGWRVTAVDIATAALDRARDHAAGLPIDWVAADLTTWTPPERRFDLVTSHYVHATADVFGRLAAAVAPGGTLLVVGHAAPEPGATDTHAHGSHITAEQVAAGLDPEAWEIEVAETRTRHGGHGGTLRDAVLRARRRL